MLRDENEIFSLPRARVDRLGEPSTWIQPWACFIVGELRAGLGNDKFHRSVEEMSRTMWAPAADGMQRQTRWYYERARGQYQDDRSRAGTAAQQKQFETMHPKYQMFTKTDLAKFENTWSQLPHFVSRGAQKNFLEFTVRLKERGQVAVDELYFQRLVAKAILFRQTEKLVQSQQYGGYRANVVTYTLAWLCNRVAQRMDLDRIWREQRLSTALQAAIVSFSKIVNEHIINAPGGGNVTEWCKKQECWEQLRQNDHNIPSRLEAELIPLAQSAETQVDKGIDALTPEERELIAGIISVSPETWFRISNWAKETNNLQGWQRSLAYSIGRLVARGKEPSRKQAVQGKKIIESAASLGCDIHASKAKV